MYDIFTTKQPSIGQLLPLELRTKLFRRIGQPKRESLWTKLRELRSIRRRCRKIRAEQEWKERYP